MYRPSGDGRGAGDPSASVRMAGDWARLGAWLPILAGVSRPRCGNRGANGMGLPLAGARTGRSNGEPEEWGGSVLRLATAREDCPRGRSRGPAVSEVSTAIDVQRLATWSR